MSWRRPIDGVTCDTESPAFLQDDPLAAQRTSPMFGGGVSMMFGYPLSAAAQRAIELIAARDAAGHQHIADDGLAELVRAAYAAGMAAERANDRTKATEDRCVRELLG